MKTRSIIRVKKYKIPRIQRSYQKLPKFSIISPQILQKQYYQYHKNITVSTFYIDKTLIKNISGTTPVVSQKKILLKNTAKHYSPSSITKKGGLFRFSQQKNISFPINNSFYLKQIQKNIYPQNILNSLGNVIKKKLELFTKEKIFSEIEKQNYFIRETFETHKTFMKQLAEKITILERSSVNELRRFLTRINTIKDK